MRELKISNVNQEKEQLSKIKEKMDRIKTNQQKFEPNLLVAKTHYEGL